MSIGKKIVDFRLRAGKTQREISQSTGLAVSYLSRLENNHINPSIRTLSKISLALGTPLTAFFDGEPAFEAEDRCPISASGRCILDQLFVGRGRRPKKRRESYTRQHLQLLQLCNFLLHTGDRETVSTISTMLYSLLALASAKDRKKLIQVMDRLSHPVSESVGT